MLTRPALLETALPSFLVHDPRRVGFILSMSMVRFRGVNPDQRPLKILVGPGRTRTCDRLL